ncbi:MAG: hypothetical protein ACFFKA_06855 [Candidatus Thorarchaeota archaeon]
MLKKRIFIHQNIPYAFNWNIVNHKAKISQVNPRRKEFIMLGTYFKRVYQGDIPNYLFNTREYHRISQFKIRGIKPSFLDSFSKKLIRDGKIMPFDSDSNLPRYAQKVFQSFKSHEISRSPGHEPILKYILIKDKNSLAIEIPIWKKFTSTYLTGHIDLIQIQGNTIKVIDYKPEGNFLYSIPQVASYGLLIKSRFNLKDVKCISFNRREAWEFDPLILLNEIREYLHNHGSKDPIWNDYLSDIITI